MYSEENIQYFGYMPIFDSAQLSLSISSYGTDTLTEQTFAVYEIVSNAYLTDKPLGAGKTERDTVFYANFDPLDPNGTHNAADRVYDPATALHLHAGRQSRPFGHERDAPAHGRGTRLRQPADAPGGRAQG